MKEDAGDAMARAVCPAMEAHGRLQGLVEADDQAVGPRRRPGFVDAHRAHAAILQGLEDTAAGRERRRDPELAFDLAHHVGAIIVLQQHEFDQPVSRCEQAHDVAFRSNGNACRIAGKFRKQRLWFATSERNGKNAMPPAFAHQHATFGGIDGNPIGKSEICGEALAFTAAGIDPPYGASRVLAHEVALPGRWPHGIGAIADIERTVGCESQSHRTVEALDYRGRAADEPDAAALEGYGERIITTYRERRNLRRRRPDYLATFNGTNLFPSGEDQVPIELGQIVGRIGGCDRVSVFQDRIGLERAIERWNGDRPAGKHIEDRIEYRHFGPQ